MKQSKTLKPFCKNLEIIQGCILEQGSILEEMINPEMKNNTIIALFEELSTMIRHLECMKLLCTKRNK